MKYTEEQEKLIRTTIQRVRIRNPYISMLKIKNLLERQESLVLDKNYVAKVIKEIDKETVQRLDQTSLKEAIGSFLNRIKEIDVHLWAILTDTDQYSVEGKLIKKGAGARDRVMAAKELRENYKEVFDVMFDAGIFNRKLGDINVNMVDVLAMAQKIEKDERFRKTIKSPVGDGSKNSESKK